jgi:hypothetical protein
MTDNTSAAGRLFLFIVTAADCMFLAATENGMDKISFYFQFSPTARAAGCWRERTNQKEEGRRGLPASHTIVARISLL